MSYDYQPAWQTVGNYTPKFIHRGNFPVRRDSVVIEKGQKLEAGSVLGRKTATNQFVLCARIDDQDTAITDGSERPICLLQIDIDTTQAPRSAPVFRTGAFLGLDLKLGKGHSLATIEDDLAIRSIFIEKGED